MAVGIDDTQHRAADRTSDCARPLRVGVPDGVDGQEWRLGEAVTGERTRAPELAAQLPVEGGRCRGSKWEACLPRPMWR